MAARNTGRGRTGRRRRDHTSYGIWLKDCEIPKLFVNAEPGSILVGPQREFCRGWRNQTEVTVRGLHFIQEDSPAEIGAAVAAFVAGLDN